MCITVGDREIEDRRRLQAFSRQHEPGENRRPSALGRGANFRIWTYNAGECAPAEAAYIAMAAQRYITDLTAAL